MVKSHDFATECHTLCLDACFFWPSRGCEDAQGPWWHKPQNASRSCVSSLAAHMSVHVLPKHRMIPFTTFICCAHSKVPYFPPTLPKKWANPLNTSYQSIHWFVHSTITAEGSQCERHWGLREESGVSLPQGHLVFSGGRRTRHQPQNSN